jgi:hypothetical protein
VVTDDTAGQPWLLRELVIEDFAERRETPFQLNIRNIGAATGTFWWDPSGPTLRLASTWTGQWPGRFMLRTEVALNAGTGSLQAGWISDLSTTGAAPEASLSLAYAWVPGGVRMRAIELSADPLSIHGDGCLLTAGRTSLQLDLAAAQVDLDALPDLSAFTGTEPEGTAEQADGLEFNIRLSADEIRKSGAIATQAVLRLGGEPDCRALDAPEPGAAVRTGMPDVADSIQ